VVDEHLVCQRHAPMSGPAAWRRELACVATHLASLRRADRPFASLWTLLAGWLDFRRGRFGRREARRPAADSGR